MTIRSVQPGVLAALILLGPTASRAEPSFEFSYVDNESGDFAARGWLDPNSSFQRDVGAAAALWGRGSTLTRSSSSR